QSEDKVPVFTLFDVFQKWLGRKRLPSEFHYSFFSPGLKNSVVAFLIRNKPLMPPGKTSQSSLKVRDFLFLGV
ncbi:hypothetical protein, partial [Streptococcus iniae]|uniref:hypothetical protein n=2 Tax=Streptococcus iniae TaxID=1346 RepID=UPI00346156AB